MTDGISVEITGLKEVSERMRSLPVALQKNGVQSSLRRAATQLKRAIVANARTVDDPSTPENIAKNIYVQTSRSYFKRTGDIMVRVGVLGGGKTKAENEANPGGDTFHWRFKEFGTVHMPASPIIRPAVQATQGQILDSFAGNLSVYIDKQLLKMGGK